MKQKFTIQPYLFVYIATALDLKSAMQCLPTQVLRQPLLITDGMI